MARGMTSTVMKMCQRYIVFTLEDTAASADDELDVEAKKCSYMKCVFVFVCFNLYDIKSVRNLITDSGEAFNKKKKKIRPPAPIQYFGVEDN